MSSAIPKVAESLSAGPVPGAVAEAGTDAVPDSRASLAGPRRTLARGCAFCVVGICAIVLAAWGIKVIGVGMGLLTEEQGNRVLLFAAFHPNRDIVPMAPATAGTFLLTAFALLLLTNRGSARARRSAALLALVAAGMGIHKLAEFAPFLPIGGWERSVVGDQGFSGEVPRGIMSPLTGASFLLIGMTLFLSSSRNSSLRLAGSSAAFLVVVGNLWILLAFLERGDEDLRRMIERIDMIGIPVAIPTAIAFALLGSGSILAGNPESFPLRPFVGPTVRARLLRTFLPLTVLLVLLGCTLSVVLKEAVERNFSPLLAAFTLTLWWPLLTGVAATAVIAHFARTIGGNLDCLEERREKLLAELRTAREAAEESDRAKSTFLANMSHELRTPLNVVIGYSEILQEEAEEAGLEDFLPDLERIRTAGKHLLSLINDILDLSKIEAGGMIPEPSTFDVRTMAETTATTIRPVVEKNGNKLDVAIGAGLGRIRTDEMRLRQCLFNLLSNAGKFTENGTVTLEVERASRSEQEWIVYRVRDTGIGMTPDQVAGLYRPFTQADLSTTRKYGGTGLGLAITKKITQMLGGTIRAESEPERGSTFTIELPAFLPPEEESKPPSTEAPGLLVPSASSAADNTILVVDDDDGVRDMLARFLTKEGFQVVGAGNGKEALRLARELRPRAITLDVMMPDMDGWSVLSQLKADPIVAGIPVIMLTIVDERDHGFALGAADYLTKPLDRKSLLETLSKYCRVTEPGLALVVEDDPSSREMLRRSLEKDGWKVIEAENGKVGLEHVAKFGPSLILLDLMMPETDGIEFLDELRRHPQWSSIHVIVITAKDLTEEDRMFLNGSLFLGGSVRKILQKGKFRREELLEEVRGFLAKPKAAQGK